MRKTKRKRWGRERNESRENEKGREGKRGERTRYEVVERNRGRALLKSDIKASGTVWNPKTAGKNGAATRHNGEQLVNS